MFVRLRTLVALEVIAASSDLVDDAIVQLFKESYAAGLVGGLAAFGNAALSAADDFFTHSS